VTPIVCANGRSVQVPPTMNQAYLLTVDGTCTDLPFAQTIGVTTTGSQITKFDQVLVRGDRCMIRQIQPIDVRQMRADQRAAAA